MRKLLCYLSILIIFFISLEIFVQSNKQAFFALSDKMLLKLEMLNKRASDHIVFLGSSKTLDAIAPNTFTSTLAKETGLEFKAFNGATTGQNLKRYLWALEKVLKMPHVKYIILETSPVNFIKGDLGFNTENNKLSSLPTSKKTVEQTLQEALKKNLFFVQIRKAFKPKIFLRLFMLWSSPFFNHDIWFRSNTIKQLTTGKDQDYKKDQFAPFKPLITQSQDNTSKNQIGTSHINDMAFKKIIELVSRSHKKIIFLNPPVAKDHKGPDCQPARSSLYKKVAAIIPSLFLDYSCHGYPKKFLDNPTHLNPDGRIFFSKMLAHDISHYLKEDQ